ncbi:MAG: MBL fold metallo-hydrolase [Planctomycetes bacterium]|nr:MBL fold metallo-hydrolase [Planctomycetota bacterium]
MIVDCRVVGPFHENAYLLGCPETGEAALIDPGDEPDVLMEMVQTSGLKVVQILNTHAHIDHVGAVAEMQRRTGAAFFLHPAEEFWLDHLTQSALSFGLEPPARPEGYVPLTIGEGVSLGHLRLRVLFTPGHSPGHVAFSIEEHETVFSGDCLFAGSIGRTDLPHGHHETLLQSIQSQLLTLPDDTRVFPGHGPPTSIGEERQSNPFLGHINKGYYSS